VSEPRVLLDAADLRRLDRLRIRRRRPSPSENPGDWRSGRVGSGVLFADHRDYVPGDDLRTVDWNVYARLGDLVVKRFEVEENLDLLLCIDRSLSMAGAKSWAARRLAAALGYIALAHLDRVRLAWLPVASPLPVTVHGGTLGASALLAAIQERAVEGQTAHGQDVGRILSVTKRRGLAVVFSDFYDAHNAVAALAGLRSQAMEVVSVHVLDGADVDLPLGESVWAVDRETRAEVKIDITEAFLETLHDSWHRRAESLQRWCLSHEVVYQRLEVGCSLWEVLAEMLGRGAAVGTRR